ncbi:sulfate/molybdate ABC transporter ATP-binding protein [Herbiconiux liangxiaofengii]|uniref:sulfate/molybdate ABC transporter ATP-binding protein n=1 Tax=Herbiconiux liangxiaofengii TaxID=3342795 RepID=UPI0035BB6D25
MTLSLDARVHERGFDAQLDLADGETVAVLGPNGAGKSTLLGVVAGLIRPDHGTATLDGAELFDLPGRHGARRWLPAHRRGVALLAQDALLFPHLSVRENVAFGPRSAGVGVRESRLAADRWLAEVDAAEFADRPPGSLSGGQAQRIAVARALAAEPRLLLLDEPLSALDAAHAPALRRMLKRVLAGRSALIVTHDILDAYTLADRVVVMDAGRVVDSGPTRSVLDRPGNVFTAGLAALNLLVGTVVGTAGTAAASPSRDEGPGGGPGAAVATVDLDGGGRIRAAVDAPLPPGTTAAVAVRPARVTLARETLEAPTGARNLLEATVIDLEQHGDTVRVRTDRLSADLSPGDAAALDLAPGVRVHCGFAAEDALAYPR